MADNWPLPLPGNLRWNTETPKPALKFDSQVVSDLSELLEMAGWRGIDVVVASESVCISRQHTFRVYKPVR